MLQVVNQLNQYSQITDIFAIQPKLVMTSNDKKKHFWYIMILKLRYLEVTDC